MDKIILLHGSGQSAASWRETISYLQTNADILYPELCSLLNGKEASYSNLYASFIQYCEKLGGSLHLCGLSLGGILALNYALDFPENVKTLVLIGTPHKVPKVVFQLQNMVFRLLPASMFQTMAFDKENTFVLAKSMKNLDFSSNMSAIQCPVRVICGQKDCANMKSARFFAQNMKQAELTILDDAGHVVNEQTPEALAAILREFYSIHG